MTQVYQTEEERRELIALAQAGSIEARNKMAETNSRLIFRAMKYVKRGGFSLEEGDLYTHGYLGLLEAVTSFDLNRTYEGKPIRFSTYAVQSCFRHMIRGLHEEGRLIRLPVHVLEKIGDMRKADGEHITETGENLTEEELAVELDFSADKVRLYLTTQQTVLSLDEPVKRTKHSEDNVTLADLIPGVKNPYRSVFTRILIEEALSALDERTREIIKKKDFEDWTLEELGNKFKRSRERIRSLRKEGLEDMQLYILRKLKIRDPEKAYRLIVK